MSNSHVREDDVRDIGCQFFFFFCLPITCQLYVLSESNLGMCVFFRCYFLVF